MPLREDWPDIPDDGPESRRQALRDHVPAPHVHFTYWIGDYRSPWYFDTAADALHVVFKDARPDVEEVLIVCGPITLTATRDEYERHFIHGERWKALELFQHATEATKEGRP